MSGSYGGGDWQRRPERHEDQQPELRQDETDLSVPESELDSPEQSPELLSAMAPAVPMDFGKRLVAAIIDLFVAYCIGAVTELFPIFNDVVPVQLVIVIVLILRDGFYGGRGVGKNLMGLQVVDFATGRPCTMLQSIKRNIIMFGAPLILYIIITIINIVHMIGISGIATAVEWTLRISNTVGFICIVLVIPYETYRAYNRADGRRFGDELAGTKTVEAPMDFSNFLGTRRSAGPR